MIHRHPIMFHPPPNVVGKETCDDSPHIKSKSGRTNDLLGVLQSVITFDHYFYEFGIRPQAWTNYHPPPI